MSPLLIFGLIFAVTSAFGLLVLGIRAAMEAFKRHRDLQDRRVRDALAKKYCISIDPRPRRKL